MFNLENYETVDERIHKFWADYPNGRIHTELVEVVRSTSGEPLQYVILAMAYKNLDDKYPSATGYAEEIVGSTNVNRTSALENCETSAIGRCLSNMSYSTKGMRPSLEEMQKVERVQATPPSQREVPAPTFNRGPEVKGTDVVIKDPNSAPSEKQKALLEKRTIELGINSDFYNQFWQFCLAGGTWNGGNDITKGEASKLIGMDKADFAGYSAAFFSTLVDPSTPD